jgi:hypothetical protein
MPQIEITPEDELYRRIVPDNLTNDELNAGAWSLRPGEDYLSVDIARLTTPQECIARARRDEIGLVAIPARIPLSLGLAVEHDPIPDDLLTGSAGNWAHAKIVGENSRPIRSRLAKASTVLVYPHRTSRP